jgi:hypothetical protein
MCSMDLRYLFTRCFLKTGAFCYEKPHVNLCEQETDCEPVGTRDICIARPKHVAGIICRKVAHRLCHEVSVVPWYVINDVR